MPESEFMSLHEASLVLGVSNATVHNWIKSGLLKPTNTNPVVSTSDTTTASAAVNASRADTTDTHYTTAQSGENNTSDKTTTNNGDDSSGNKHSNSHGIVLLSSDVLSLKKDIETGSVNKLKSRRNKNAAKGIKSYADYMHDSGYNYAIGTSIVNKYADKEIDNKLVRFILADLALKLYYNATGIDNDDSDSLLDFLYNNGESSKKFSSDDTDVSKNSSHDDDFTALLLDLLQCGLDDDSYQTVKQLSDDNSSILNTINHPVFVQFQDFLGYIYNSINNIGNRKSTGSYFTPINVVEHMITNVLNCMHETSLDSHQAKNNGGNTQPWSVHEVLPVHAHASITPDNTIASNESTDSTVNNTCEHTLTNSSMKNKKILDPACGTGNFLLCLLKNGVKPDYIYGNDIDSIAVSITRINLYLNGVHNVSILASHIMNNDFLTSKVNTKYDVIIGNPPWGYNFTAIEVNSLMNMYTTASKNGTESYDVFIEQAIRCATGNAIIAFVLPEAILNVKSHSNVRKLIRDNCRISFVSYIGNAFTGVYCPCILLGIQKLTTGIGSVAATDNSIDSSHTDSADSVSTASIVNNTIDDNVRSDSNIGCKVETIGLSKSFIINEPRDLTSDYWNFMITDDAVKLLSKIENGANNFILKGNANFALGILTGSNKKFLQKSKNADNEQIIRGSDVFKYGYQIGSNYIKFEPEKLQQVAPVRMYKAPEKLFYRFISETPVFAYDDKQLLSLNSCNILIPHVSGIDMKYILAVLNSRVISYYYMNKYNSNKMLRQHIENIPLPIPDYNSQHEIITNVNKLISTRLDNSAERFRLFGIIDNKIMDLYKLDDNEKLIIKNETSKYNALLAI